MRNLPYRSNYSLTSTLDLDDENRWYTMITNDVSVEDEGHEGYEKTIAKASFYHIDVEGALADKLSAFALFDLSGWLQLFHEALYKDADCSFNEEVVDIIVS
jgi:hypothetical protein